MLPVSFNTILLPLKQNRYPFCLWLIYREEGSRPYDKRESEERCYEYFTGGNKAGPAERTQPTTTGSGHTRGGTAADFSRAGQRKDAGHHPSYCLSGAG